MFHGPVERLLQDHWYVYPVPPVMLVVTEPVVVDPHERSLMTFDTAVKAEPVTVISNVDVAVNPPASVTVKVMVLVPVCPATGVYANDAAPEVFG